jgi:N-acetylglucosamine malate deacetylase 1
LKLDKERLLVIAPHPDDEILGCYGLMEEVKRNKGKVFVMILTLGGYTKINGKKVSKKTWKNEFQKSMNFIGVDDSEIIFFNDEIKHLDEIPQSQLIEMIESKSKVSISKIKPTIVAVPTIFSSHQDHVYAYKTAITALRPQPQKSSFMPNMVISYESPEYYFWSSYSEFGKFSPNFYLQFSKKTLDNKIKALNMYQSQIKPDHRDGQRIESLSKIRGSEIGVEYAESFHIHRHYL